MAVQPAHAAAPGFDVLAMLSTLWCLEQPTWPQAALLIVVAALYVVHVGRILRTRGWRALGWRAVSYVAALAVLGMALVSPLDALTRRLASAHMAQYCLLTAVAPPLLLAGWAPGDRAAGGAAPFACLERLSPLRDVLAQPLLVGSLDVALLIFWHLRPVYQAAESNDLLRAVEQGTFLAGAVLYWQLVERPAGRINSHPAGALVCILATSAIAAGFALIMFSAATPWYPQYEDSTAAWGLTPTQDQQLAGVLLAAPGDTLDAALFLWVLVLWMRQEERDLVVRRNA